MQYILGAVDDIYEGLEHARIEDCYYRGGCKKQWGELNKTKDRNKRYCRDCKKHVHLLHTMDELEQAQGEPICAAYLYIPKLIGLDKPSKKRNEDV